MPQRYQDEDLLSLLLQNSEIGQESPLNINFVMGNHDTSWHFSMKGLKCLGQQGQPNS